MRIRLDILHPHDEGSIEPELAARVARVLGVPKGQVAGVAIVKRALDARRKLRVPTWRFTVDAEVDPEPRRPARHLNVREPRVPGARLASPLRPGRTAIVVGAGPAGLFCAWRLAEHGMKVHLVERGKPVETRARDFGQFRGRAILDPESNLCFGEGGAGTYSDGKLTTRKNDPLGAEVLERLVDVGAPPAILVDAKPHIGTNKLFRVLKGIRAALEAHGVEIHFQSKVVGLLRVGGKVAGVRLDGGGDLRAERVVLAMGHSARDTFEWLQRLGVPMEVKPFAVGVRAEHPQQLIDASQYRIKGQRPSTLPPADYRLAHTEGDRGIYSFCMCPGGMIVPTATEPGTVVVNGMSSARRSTPFANSGVIVQVTLADLEREGFGRSALAGLEFQRALESQTFVAGGSNYFAPAMLATDLLRGKATGRLADSNFRPGLTPSDLRDFLPSFIVDGLAAGLRSFNAKLHGYASDAANLIAVESRTSSPIRIERDPTSTEVPGFPGLHVAGEGPGYAGGIMSAAIDGIKVAHALLVDLE